MKNKIKRVTAFQTPDGRIFLTEIDARLHIGGVGAQLATICQQITDQSRRQRWARSEIKCELHKAWYTKDYSKVNALRKSIAERSKMLGQWFKRRAELAASFDD